MTKKARRSSLQKDLLRLLALSGGVRGLRIAQLASATARHHSIISRAIKRLEVQHLVRREKDGMVVITPEGSAEATRLMGLVSPKSSLLVPEVAPASAVLLAEQFRMAKRMSDQMHAALRPNLEILKEMGMAFAQTQVALDRVYAAVRPLSDVLKTTQSLGLGMQDLMAGIRAAVEPTLQLRQMMSEFSRGIDGLSIVTAQLSEFRKAQERAFRDIVSFMHEIDRARAVWRDSLSDTLQLLDSVFRAARIRLVQRAVLCRGWLVSPSLSDIYAELYKHVNEEPEELERHLVDLLEGRALEMLSQTFTHPSFARRRSLLEMAGQAHARGEFPLAIPIFLAQADGIVKETFRRDAFRRKKHSLRLMRSVRSAVELDFWTYLFDHVAARVNGGDGLHRHPIMHGLTLTYGNRSNSLRAILLLHYLWYLLSRRDKPTH
jgi:Mn-dependent DtxR family transcriptional regulator